ncbi:hypothetical protein CJ030_MR2G003171 [Morella rubra]|uniref:Uncharacterized protein n=1 Tax=Morella rubra TaxID=262757 RepID=A0A6A1WD41_9ROSI|nr:hypothetical protein CJ030_MR2G003171 [Morella rubra]
MHAIEMHSLIIWFPEVFSGVCSVHPRVGLCVLFSSWDCPVPPTPGPLKTTPKRPEGAHPLPVVVGCTLLMCPISSLFLREYLAGLEIIKRFERTTSDDLHVYVVHNKDETSYFTKGAGDGSSMRAGEGSSKGVGQGTAEGTIELDDEAVEDLGEGEGEGDVVAEGTEDDGNILKRVWS